MFWERDRTPFGLFLSLIPVKLGYIGIKTIQRFESDNIFGCVVSL